MHPVTFNTRVTSKLLFLTGLAALSGCHQLTPDQRIEAWMDSGGKSAPMFLSSEELSRLEARRYISVLRTSLAHSVFEANGNALAGNVKLQMKLDRQGNILLCEAKPTDGDASSGFANLVSDVCWSSVWNAVPKGLQNPADGSLEVIAPLIATGNAPATSDYERGRQSSTANSRFFWDNVMAKHSYGSFGRARFDVKADESGKVVRCDVTLEKSAFRSELFHPDPELEKALAAQCLLLDLRKMSGFRIGKDGTARHVVWVTYLPWKKNVGKY